MKIRKLIKKYFDAGPVIFDCRHNQVPVNILWKEFNAIKYYLYSKYKPQSRVAIGLNRDYRYFLALLACMDLGIIFIPIRNSWPNSYLQRIRDVCNYDETLTDAVIEEAIYGYSLNEQVSFELYEISLNDYLYCLFTSGTTGTPKGVLITRKSYENFLSWCDSYFYEIDQTDRLINSTDYTFDVSLAEVGLVLTRNVKFYCSNFRDDLFTLINELNDLQISVIATVPNNLQILINKLWLDRVDLSRLRHVLIAGSRFPVSLRYQFQEFLPNTNIYNCYGPTEATIYCLVCKLNDFEDAHYERGTVSVGKPIPGCIPLVVSSSGKKVENYEEGELLIGGVQVMDSYINNFDATNAAIVIMDGIRYYKTGDIAFTNGDGEYFVTGRNDDTIKVSGQRVNISDIDSNIQECDFVEICASLAIEDMIRGYSIVTFILPKYEINKEEVFCRLRQKLPSHQMPQDIVFINSIPINNSGKICKKTLKNMYSKTIENGY